MNRIKGALIVGILLAACAGLACAQIPTEAKKIFDSIVCNIICLIKYVVLAVAAVIVVVSGLQYATAEDPKVRKHTRWVIIYAFLGLILVLLGEPILRDLLNSSRFLSTFACECGLTSEKLVEIVNDLSCEIVCLVEYIIAAVAALMIVYAGLRYLVEQDPAARKSMLRLIVQVFIGLLIVLVAVPALNYVTGDKVPLLDCDCIRIGGAGSDSGASSGAGSAGPEEKLPDLAVLDVTVEPSDTEISKLIGQAVSPIIGYASESTSPQISFSILTENIGKAKACNPEAVVYLQGEKVCGTTYAGCISPTEKKEIKCIKDQKTVKDAVNRIFTGEGTYMLKAEIDPQKKIKEKTRENNVYEKDIILSATKLEVQSANDVCIKCCTPGEMGCHIRYTDENNNEALHQSDDLVTECGFITENGKKRLAIAQETISLKWTISKAECLTCDDGTVPGRFNSKKELCVWNGKGTVYELKKSSLKTYLEGQFCQGSDCPCENNPERLCCKGGKLAKDQARYDELCQRLETKSACSGLCETACGGVKCSETERCISEGSGCTCRHDLSCTGGIEFHLGDENKVGTMSSGEVWASAKCTDDPKGEYKEGSIVPCDSGVIEWGDGKSDSFTPVITDNFINHLYGQVGQYQVKLTCSCAGKEKTKTLDWEIVKSPEKIDLREFPGPIGDQGTCASCWAFASTAAMEAAYNYQEYKATGVNPGLDLSEQDLISCSKETDGCIGSDIEKALDYLKDTGITEYACFGYQEQGSSCQKCTQTGPSYECRQCEPACICKFNDPCTNTQCSAKKSGCAVYKITGWKWLLGMTEMKKWINEKGPIAVTADVTKEFNFASNNCIPDQCGGNQIAIVGHSMLIVGYDDSIVNGDGSKGAWIVRNSFGSNWNGNGHVYIAYGACGIGYYGYGIEGVVRQ